MLTLKINNRKQIRLFNKMLKKNFQIIKKLGTGSFGTVYKVKRLSDNQIYALKKVFLPKLSKKGFLFLNY